MSKRLFFAFHVDAPWPPSLPLAKTYLAEEKRHLTIAFLGQTDEKKVASLLSKLPTPSFQVSRVGQFQEALFLPPKTTNAATWQVDFLKETQALVNFVTDFQQFLLEHDINCENRFLPHVTLARGPSSFEEWKKAFAPSPCILGDLHLFESLGKSTYRSLWSRCFLRAFEKKESGFLVRGHSFEELFFHTLAALSFDNPKLFPVKKIPQITSFFELLDALQEHGKSHHTSLKGMGALSFPQEVFPSLYEWDIIIR